MCAVTCAAHEAIRVLRFQLVVLPLASASCVSAHIRARMQIVRVYETHQRIRTSTQLHMIARQHASHESLDRQLGRGDRAEQKRTTSPTHRASSHTIKGSSLPMMLNISDESSSVTLRDAK